MKISRIVDIRRFYTDHPFTTLAYHAGILTGTNFAAPPALWGNSGDVNFGIMTMSPNERYTSLRILVTISGGDWAGDYSGRCGNTDVHFVTVGIVTVLDS